jgi:hypothetical protein
MKKLAVIGGAVLLCGAIVALLVPMWTMTAGMEMSGHGWTAIILMLVFCFGIGGGLMFLIFYSARRGHDDAVHFGASDNDRGRGLGEADLPGPVRHPPPPPGGSSV